MLGIAACNPIIVWPRQDLNLHSYCYGQRAYQLTDTVILKLKPTSYLIAISSIGSWMTSFILISHLPLCLLCQWNTIASYGKCLLVIRRCLKLYPVSMSVRCDIDLTVIFKSGRILYWYSICLCTSDTPAAVSPSSSRFFTLAGSIH